MEIIEKLEQGSSEWLETRAGVITGTRLKQVMAKKGTETRKGLIYELIAEKLAPLEENYSNDTMERGHLLEEVLKEEMQDIEEVGFIFGDKKWYGLSPDGIKRDKNGKIIKAYEIKSPKAKNYIKYAINKKIPAEYKWQVVHYFIVIKELQELDFIIFNPEIIVPELRKITLNIKREDLKDDIQKAKEALIDFRVEWLENLKKLQES